MSTEVKKTKKTALSGNGNVKNSVNKPKKLTKKQLEFVELFRSVKGLFREEFEKGIMKHPVRQ